MNMNHITVQNVRNIRGLLLLGSFAALLAGNCSAQSKTDASQGGPYKPDKETVLLMHFDEGTGDPKDSSEAENNGTIKGGVKWEKKGVFGSALSFDGQTGYVDVGNDDSLGLGGPLTVEVWVNPQRPEGNDIGIVGRKAGVTGGYMLFNGSAMAAYAYLTTTDQQHHYIPSPIKLQEDKWQHLSFTYDGVGTVKWYLNGEEIVDKGAKPTSGQIVTVKGSKFMIGMYGGDRFYKGLIDELRVSNVVRQFSPFTPASK